MYTSPDITNRVKSKIRDMISSNWPELQIPALVCSIIVRRVFQFDQLVAHIFTRKTILRANLEKDAVAKKSQRIHLYNPYRNIIKMLQVKDNSTDNGLKTKMELELF